MTHMKRAVRFLRCCILVSLAALAVACGVSRSYLDPDRPYDPDDGTNPRVRPPASVSASYVEDGVGAGRIEVQWDASAPGYALYRRLGNGDWLLIAAGLDDERYVDTRYYENAPVGNDRPLVRYAVRGLSGHYESTLSAPSVGTAPVVTGANASILSEIGRIRLRWEAHPEADSYRVYRYENQVDPSVDPVLVASGLAASALPYWDDASTSPSNAPTPLVPYQYLVTWVRDGHEYGLEGGGYALGVYSSSADRYEPNDNSGEISDDSSVFDPAQPPFIYSFADASGDQVRDADWYLWNAPAGESFIVRVTLPPGGGVPSGSLVFRFYAGGVFYPAVGQEIAEGTNEFRFTNFPAGATGTVPVYFVVETKPNLTTNVFGTYGVEIVTSL